MSKFYLFNLVTGSHAYVKFAYSYPTKEEDKKFMYPALKDSFHLEITEPLLLLIQSYIVDRIEYSGYRRQNGRAQEEWVPTLDINDLV